MDVKAYLARIGIGQVLPPTAENLARIQLAHLRAVPYENLDTMRGIALSLSHEKLFEKIVVRRRGGWCFELNELYGQLLRELGYEVIDYFARFLRGESGIPMRRHHVLGVRVPGEETLYIADVGVGNGSPTQPVVLEENTVQEQDDAVWRFVRDEFLGWVLQENKKGAWENVFSFTREPQLPIDFEAVSFYCEQSPDSIFNKKNIVSLRIPDGRVTLDGTTFKRFDKDGVTVWEAKDEQDFALQLETLFGLIL